MQTVKQLFTRSNAKSLSRCSPRCSPTKALSADVRLCSLMFESLNWRYFRTATNTHEQPALNWGTRGRGFKSRQCDSNYKTILPVGSSDCGLRQILSALCDPTPAALFEICLILSRHEKAWNDLETWSRHDWNSDTHRMRRWGGG